MNNSNMSLLQVVEKCKAMPHIPFTLDQLDQFVSNESVPIVCYTCFAVETPEKKLHSCSLCRCAMYCSVECQRIDWKAEHKEHCPGRGKPPSILRPTHGWKQFVSYCSMVKSEYGFWSQLHAPLMLNMLTHMVLKQVYNFTHYVQFEISRPVKPSSNSFIVTGYN